MTDQVSNRVQVYFVPSNPEVSEDTAEEVVLSEDVAQETIIVTTTDEESVCDDYVEPHVVPIGDLDVLNTIELSCDENFQPSLEDPSTITPSDLRDGCEETFVQSYIALVPDNGLRSNTDPENCHLTVKEHTKREKDKIYKREQRANKEYREQEKIVAKQRMKNRRKDPEYRERERRRDAERKRLARLNNKEFRQKEKERDRQYKRSLRKKSDAKIQIELTNGADCDNSPSLNSASVSDNLTVGNCFTVLDWAGIGDVDDKLDNSVEESEVTDYQVYTQVSI
ncbi:zinc finger CCCH domain-containing protein 13-like [Saccostrea cucullata]|uniref:zinc finger CCCH domain-containing protein 13-like n=1 Tax=Saccostrea cuccullata TaxID=36930 RepID=UPI002ED11345